MKNNNLYSSLTILFLVSILYLLGSIELNKIFFNSNNNPNTTYLYVQNTVIFFTPLFSYIFFTFTSFMVIKIFDDKNEKGIFVLFSNMGFCFIPLLVSNLLIQYLLLETPITYLSETQLINLKDIEISFGFKLKDLNIISNIAYCMLYFVLTYVIKINYKISYLNAALSAVLPSLFIFIFGYLFNFVSNITL